MRQPSLPHLDSRRDLRYCLPRRAGLETECCRSSVVEHSLGKGEVVGSIPTGSTTSRKWVMDGRAGAAGAADGEIAEKRRVPALRSLPRATKL